MKKVALSLLFGLFLSFPSFSNPIDDAEQLYKSGEYNRAIEIIEKILKTDSQNPDLYLLLSKSYEGNFDVDKSIQNFKLYQKYKDLKSINNKKKEEEIKPSISPEIEKETLKEEKDEFELVSVNNEYIFSVIDKRVLSKEEGNKKFFDAKKIKEIIQKIPLDTDELALLRKKLDFKSKFALNTQEDAISLEKIKLSLNQLDLDIKKYEISQETDDKKIKVKKEEAKNIISSYNKTLALFDELVNTPVFPNTDQTSYDYFRYSESIAERHLVGMEAFRKSIVDGIININNELDGLKLDIVNNEKKISELKSLVSDEMIKSKDNSLTESDKINVSKYNELVKKIDDNKLRIIDIIWEQDILYTANEKIKKTISQIKPDYVFTDDKLPNQTKLEQMKKDNSENKNTSGNK
ncbi:MAG: hypothetical protein AABZ74_09235 [Cyanobacteriota bacterium]